ncbi:hydroxyisourate hydrolase [Glycomyces mayteni]|uniref:5-hydroxyisourate hydrolase n=1 Tax=Glycomyces mayteni TaxID=543887 RepID=A0ABW2DB22_9ACTN|nr:hydroxyisourate hydrolase [Glycomyces mayteni]
MSTADHDAAPAATDALSAAAAPAPTVSSHVLDAATGRPAAGVRLTLLRREDSAPGGDAYMVVRTGSTDADGRVAAWRTAPGVHRLRFDTGAWFAARGTDTFYPEVDVAFTVADGHHHVPLLLSPFAYSTYRGS